MWKRKLPLSIKQKEEPAVCIHSLPNILSCKPPHAVMPVCGCRGLKVLSEAVLSPLAS